ncbi:unnamed protein product [Paramecium octaurelia]|uniref:Uncharacterized protein n=1 Tax=Paramecium octaurelia TaxID=43137 RepID=A0A8S1UMW9_PAROT|nr:unnamed protein product [Paramecium octaurelia]
MTIFYIIFTQRAYQLNYLDLLSSAPYEFHQIVFIMGVHFIQIVCLQIDCQNYSLFHYGLISQHYFKLISIQPKYYVLCSNIKPKNEANKYNLEQLIMNLDQYQSTEEDWLYQSRNENELFDISSSPIQFGRQTYKIKHEKELNYIDFHNQIQQIEQPLEVQDCNQISIDSIIPQRRNKIKKNKKIKNKTIKNLYKEIFQRIIENTRSKQEALKKLQQCQNMKVMIDELERSLMKIKYVLLLKTKTNEC